MDLTGIETIIPPVAQALGIEPATALLGLGILVTVANITGRLIPDDATGFLGGLRGVCKAIGLYVPNKITSKVSVNDIASAVVGTMVEDKVQDLAADAEALIPEVVRDAIAPFPDHPRREG